MVIYKKGYLLDTCIVIALLRKNPEVRDKILSVKRKNCFISEMTIAELYFGAAKSERYEKQVKDVYLILSKFKVIPVYRCFELYGKYKWELQKRGTPIGDIDILIGATAIKENLIMVTNNTKHFNNLPDIQLEDWLI